MTAIGSDTIEQFARKVDSSSGEIVCMHSSEYLTGLAGAAL